MEQNVLKARHSNFAEFAGQSGANTLERINCGFIESHGMPG
jgi:hypothetical protein